MGCTCCNKAADFLVIILLLRYTKGRKGCWLFSYEKSRVMMEPFFPLTALSEAQRAQAFERFTIIRPALEDGVSQAQVSRTSKKAESTVRLWIKRYRAGQS